MCMLAVTQQRNPIKRPQNTIRRADTRGRDKSFYRLENRIRSLAYHNTIASSCCLSIHVILESGLAAAGGKCRHGQRLLPLHPATRRAAMRRNADGLYAAELVLRAVRGHMGAQQLPKRCDAGAACRVRRGETNDVLSPNSKTWRSRVLFSATLLRGLVVEHSLVLQGTPLPLLIEVIVFLSLWSRDCAHQPYLTMLYVW